jgi:hypothetical protein
MFSARGLGWLRRGTGRKVLAAVLAFQAVVIVIVFAAERAGRRADQAQIAFNLNPDVWWTRNIAGPTVRPPIHKASVAKIEPGEVVIGVEVGGNARAYRLAAFDDASGHLVNDLLGGVPVSVSYCEQARRQGPPRLRPLARSPIPEGDGGVESPGKIAALLCGHLSSRHDSRSIRTQMFP